MRAPGAAIDEAAILAALEGRLAKFKQPKRVFFVDELPRNTMGKVQKAALREATRGRISRERRNCASIAALSITDQTSVIFPSRNR